MAKCKKTYSYSSKTGYMKRLARRLLIINKKKDEIHIYLPRLYLDFSKLKRVNHEKKEKK